MFNRREFQSVLMVIAALICVPGPAGAGGTEDDNDLCFRAQGCPECNESFLLEFGATLSSRNCGESPWVNGAVGLLWNVGSSYGLGGKMFVGADDCGERFGLRVVGRRWITPQLSLEAAPGVAFGGTDRLKYPIFSLQLALDIAGIVAPVYHMEMIRPQYGGESRLETVWGARVSSYAAPVAAIGIGIALAIVVSSMSSWS